MLTINKPNELEQVQCYKCKAVMHAHPMTNINSEYFTNCDLHKCQHESDGMLYCTSPRGSQGDKWNSDAEQSKCKKCGEHYT